MNYGSLVSVVTVDCLERLTGHQNKRTDGKLPITYIGDKIEKTDGRTVSD